MLMCIWQCRKERASRWGKVKEKQSKSSGQLWDLCIREIKAHNMKEVHEVLFLTLSTAMILQTQMYTHQIERFPINQ